MHSVRAVYQDGQLRLLEPLDLREGQEVHVQIVESAPNFRDLIADLLIQFDETENPIEWDDDSAQQALDPLLHGLPSLSEIIIEDRNR
ncbi:MAG: antitoxin family protein [bacterium]|nr:antitoxin family protein [bacterium]